MRTITITETDGRVSGTFREIEPVVVLPDDQVKKRNKQKNLKATAECLTIFSECARVQGVTESALFEDMVAERVAYLERKHGVTFKAKQK